MPGAGTSTQNQNVSRTDQNSGTNTSTNQSSNTSSSGPLAAAQPLIGNILSTLGGLANTTPNPAQSEAVANLQGAADQIPNFGASAAGAVNPILDGTYGGMLTGAFDTLKSNLSPYLSGSYLNPMSTPGLSDALNATNQSITNQINDQFAAAGRDLSPANTRALAAGLAQGEAPILTNQYNTNVGNQLGAINTLYGAGNTTPQMLTQLATSGINAAGAVPGLYTAPATSQLNAANTAYSMPFNNLGMLSGLALPIAGLGQTSSGTNSGTSAGTSSSTGSGTTLTNGSSALSPIGMLQALLSGGDKSAAAGGLGLLFG